MSSVMPDVFVVDNHVSVRESLEALIRQAGGGRRHSHLRENSSRTHTALRRTHRGQVMREMKTRSIAGLAKMAASLSGTGSR